MAETAQILAAVDNLIRVHNLWESDPNSPPVPTVEIETAINRAYQDSEGDTPAQCRDLVIAIGRLVVEWNKYAEDPEARDRLNRPLPSFWAAFRAMQQARETARTVAYKRPELVKELRTQKVTDRQICLIYSDNGKPGPLCDENGHPDPFKIDAEVATPGIHTKAWIDEQARKFHDAQVKGLPSFLQQAPVTMGVSSAENARPAANNGPTEKASILEMLKEGAFADQIAKVKQISVEEVLQVAAANNIEPVRKPTMGELKTYVPPAEAPKDGGGEDAPASPAKKRGRPPKAIESRADADGVDVDALILEQFAAGKGGPEVARELAHYGVSVNKANAVWRAHRNKAKGETAPQAVESQPAEAAGV